MIISVSDQFVVLMLVSLRIGERKLVQMKATFTETKSRSNARRFAKVALHWTCEQTGEGSWQAAWSSLYSGKAVMVAGGKQDNARCGKGAGAGRRGDRRSGVQGGNGGRGDDE